jgi:hypothetical protein
MMLYIWTRTLLFSQDASPFIVSTAVNTYLAAKRLPDQLKGDFGESHTEALPTPYASGMEANLSRLTTRTIMFIVTNLKQLQIS